MVAGEAMPGGPSAAQDSCGSAGPAHGRSTPVSEATSVTAPSTSASSQQYTPLGQCRGSRYGRQHRARCHSLSALSVRQHWLLVTTIATAALLAPAAATEINSAVSIFGPWDYMLREDGTSRCTDMVDRTVELGLNSRTMFLPTLFWVSKHSEGFFERNEVGHQAGRPAVCC